MKNSKTERMKAIFISYSSDAGFMERRFVAEVVRQLKENNLHEDIWFDKDEKIIDSPLWFSLRMEAMETCRAAVLILSDRYYVCPVSLYEGKALLERRIASPDAVKLFPVVYRHCDRKQVPERFWNLLDTAVDLSCEHATKSIAEMVSVVIGALAEQLERYSTPCSVPPDAATSPDSEFTGEYRKKAVCLWSASNLQEWLFNIGVQEFYRQNLAEAMVDGFLLMSATEHDMVSHLGIESQAERKNIVRKMLLVLDSELTRACNWHLRARAQKPKPDVVYIIYDPSDVSLSQTLKLNLKKRNFQVIHHSAANLDCPKLEFLQINGPQLAASSHVVILMTDALSSSPFTFNEVLFADWLGKRLIIAMFKNVWNNLRVSLKAILGDCPAVDFETKMFSESLDVLVNHIKPVQNVPCVVLEQAYLDRMARGLKPLEVMATSKDVTVPALHRGTQDAKVFISCQTDIHSKIEKIQHLIELSGIPCWTSITLNSLQTAYTGHSSHFSSSLLHVDAGNEFYNQRIINTCCVVLCCITPKYLQCDNCVKELSAANALHKHIIPLLLRCTPIERSHEHVHRILRQHHCIDMSNDRLYKQNIGLVVDRVRKIVRPKLVC